MLAPMSQAQVVALLREALAAQQTAGERITEALTTLGTLSETVAQLEAALDAGGDIVPAEVAALAQEVLDGGKRLVALFDPIADPVSSPATAPSSSPDASG